MPSASHDFDATDVPRALEDVLGLSIGVRYTVHNVGESVALLRLAATQPAADARGHAFGPYGVMTVEPETGAKTWVWSRDPDGAQIIVSTAA